MQMSKPKESNRSRAREYSAQCVVGVGEREWGEPSINAKKITEEGKAACTDVVCN